jgi:hypothetical protein
VVTPINSGSRSCSDTCAFLDGYCNEANNPVALLAFLTEQLAIDPASFTDYAERNQTRRAHLAEIQTALGYRPLHAGFTVKPTP